MSNIGYSSPDWGMAGEDAAYTRAQAISEAKQEAFVALEDDIEYLVMKTAFEYRESLKECQDETPRQWEYRMSLRDGAAWISDEMMEVMENAIEDDHYYTREEVEILDYPDSCEFCKSQSGMVYRSSEAPVLPHAQCTHKSGCRCCYLPVI